MPLSNFEFSDGNGLSQDTRNSSRHLSQGDVAHSAMRKRSKLVLDEGLSRKDESSQKVITKSSDKERALPASIDAHMVTTVSLDNSVAKQRGLIRVGTSLKAEASPGFGFHMIPIEWHKIDTPSIKIE